MNFGRPDGIGTRAFSLEEFCRGWAAAVGPGFLTRTIAPLVAGRPYDLRLVVDRSSVEAYAQSGTIAMTDLIFPSSVSSRVEVFSGTGKPPAVKGEIWRLRPIWNSTR